MNWKNTRLENNPHFKGLQKIKKKKNDVISYGC